jgi:NAD(P)-dependent dehydrogenase (short-subunit alcohol dehydrogenase family)
MSGPLTARVALVTGSGWGTGEEIALSLADAGATVICNDIDPARAEAVAGKISAAGARAIPAVFDITDDDAVSAGIAAAVDGAGPVDILVSNAGMPKRRLQRPFIESTPADWRPFIDLNLYGSLYCLRAVLPGMCQRGWGRVVQLSSGAAARGIPLPAGYTALGASKAAIEGALRHIAVEVAADGVTVNTVALGQMENAVDHAEPEVVAMVRAMTPVGRPGTPREAATAVAWLCSPDAGFITGQVIHVNGGSYQGR